MNWADGQEAGAPTYPGGATMSFRSTLISRCQSYGQLCAEVNVAQCRIIAGLDQLAWPRRQVTYRLRRC